MVHNSSKYFIGTSGWNYKAWKTDFYKGVKQKEWLEHYAKHFRAVEVNATFYRLLQENVFQSWHSRTPDDFFFAVKGSRYITHTRRLKNPLEAILNQKNNVSPLQPKIPAVLWQLPATLPRDIERLREFAEALGAWPEARHALEFRDASWFQTDVADLLGSHSLAVCISDAADWPRWDEISTDMVYIRLHGSTETYRSGYGDDELDGWARMVRQQLEAGRIVHVYFDNTDDLAAPRNALRLKDLIGEQLPGNG